MILHPSSSKITMTAITDPEYLARASAQRKQFARNVAWVEAHASEVYSHRGKVVCVAGQELFVADTVEEVVAWAEATHPNDKGIFTKYVPVSRAPRIGARQTH